jgi:hypothetical protein
MAVELNIVVETLVASPVVYTSNIVGQFANNHVANDLIFCLVYQHHSEAGLMCGQTMVITHEM